MYRITGSGETTENLSNLTGEITQAKFSSFSPNFGTRCLNHSPCSFSAERITKKQWEQRTAFSPLSDITRSARTVFDLRSDSRKVKFELNSLVGKLT